LKIWSLFVKGDYGSALVVKNRRAKRWHQVGVLSSGYSDQKTLQFMRVSAFVEWIQKTIETPEDIE
jgi:hypothetical protein